MTPNIIDCSSLSKAGGGRPGPGGEGRPLLGVGLHGLLLALPPTKMLAGILVGGLVCEITLACTIANCQQTFEHQQLAL